MLNPLQYGSQFAVTATHATAAAATKDAASGKTHIAVTVGASSDKAGAILLVKSGSTTIWQQQVGAGHIELVFPAGLRGTEGAAMSVEIDGTSACKANLCGITV